MFVPDAAMDKACLRQGDILKNILYPLLIRSDIRVLGSYSLSEPPNSNVTFQLEEVTYRQSPALRCLASARITFAAVISQCCDIEPRNGKIVQASIALARLVPVPPSPAKDAAKFASLSANKYPLNPDDPGYFNYFYITSNELLDGKDWVVDYNQVLSIPAAEFPAIMQHKVLQMDADTRIKFKIKLAASFARLTQEEEALDHPWVRIKTESIDADDRR